jgi:hypothetical protein
MLAVARRLPGGGNFEVGDVRRGWPVSASAVGVMSIRQDSGTKLIGKRPLPNPTVIAALKSRWRVVDDPLQWILQGRRGRKREGRSGMAK